MVARVGIALGVAGAVLTAGAAASQSTPKGTKPRTITRVPGHIIAIAQSTSRLAWLRYTGRSSCPVAEVLELRQRRRVRISGARRRDCDAVGVWNRLDRLAFDGNRVLWQRFSGSPSGVSIQFFTAAVNDRRTRAPGHAWRSYDSSNEFLPMAGADGRLVYHFRCDDRNRCSPPAVAREVRRFVGRRTRRLYEDEDLVGLAVAGTRLAALASGVEIRDVRTGTLLYRLWLPRHGGRGEAISMASTYLAVVILRNGPGLELWRFGRNGAFLGRSQLPPGADPYHLTVGARAMVFANEGQILAVDAKTGKTTMVAELGASPVGLSILGRRVVWAENLDRFRARVRAIDLPR